MEDYDIIFAGAGPAACVTAGRLAAADPTLKILLLEAGPHTFNVLQNIQPAQMLRNLAPGSNTVTFNVGKPSPSLLGRSGTVITGHCVGGGSCVNLMVYTRAAASDYDDWEKIYGNEGWGSDKLIPLLKKAETYQEKIYNNTHGTTGPIQVSYSRDFVKIGDNFLDVAKVYDKGRGLTNDINAFTVTDKYGRWAKYVGKDTGRRSDAAHHYVYNQSGDINLKILANSRVIQVIIENGRAVGVKYIPEVSGASGDVQPTVVRASRLVVLSAGGLGSFAILERSGIGSSEILKKNGIPQLVDLPGVGEHYMDHVIVLNSYYASDDAESMDSILRGTDIPQEYQQEWLEHGSGPLAQNGFDGLGRLRPTAEELKAMSPEFDDRWKAHFENALDKPVLQIGPFAAYYGKDPSIQLGGQYFSLEYMVSYPVSTGSVHITSGLDPKGQLDFRPGFLDEPADLVVLRWGYKKTRELARRMKYYRGEIISGHPTFPPGSAATPRSSATPVDISAPDIVYSKEDDIAIDRFHRETADSTYHPSGTCAMKSRNQGGVVDQFLNVYGVKNLKVADMSILPGNVGANTYNTALAIGEKAAIIIARELGIKLMEE